MTSIPMTSEMLQQLGRLCASHAVTELALFGSAARGTQTRDSDIDLLVTFAEGTTVTFGSLARFQREAEALLGRPVDVVPRSGLKESIRDAVIASSRVLYAA